uniref:Sulfate permease 2 n=1 Tax=Anthurium amnicola TaxID=1678845 RepID=A0A1D1XFX5_9ARAE
MNRNFIFVFILLTTLSIVNAIPFNKRKADFEACYTVVYPEPGVDVTITPDPPVAKTPEHFTISGILKHDITADKTVVDIDFFDGLKFVSIIPPYIKKFTESVKAGVKFSIDVDNVPTPNEFPSYYAIYVSVGENPDKDGKLQDIFGCSVAEFSS